MSAFTKNQILLAALMVLAIFSSQTRGADRGAVSVGDFQGELPVVTLQYLSSQKGETKLQFLFRVSVFLEEYTRNTAFEGCGLIWESPEGDAWTVPVTTNESHIGCIITTLSVPTFRSTGESIHSHPDTDQARFRVNRSDYIVMMGKARLNTLKKSHGATFSMTDLAHPGYLVAHGQVLYQDGTGVQSIRSLGPTQQ